MTCHDGLQMRLLQSTWAEMLSLMVAYRSMCAGGSPRLRFAADFALDEQQARELGAHDLYTQVCTGTQTQGNPTTYGWMVSFLIHI